MWNSISPIIVLRFLQHSKTSQFRALVWQVQILMKKIPGIQIFHLRNTPPKEPHHVWHGWATPPHGPGRATGSGASLCTAPRTPSWSKCRPPCRPTSGHVPPNVCSRGNFSWEDGGPEDAWFESVQLVGDWNKFALRTLPCGNELLVFFFKYAPTCPTTGPTTTSPHPRSDRTFEKLGVARPQLFSFLFLLNQ